MIDYKHKYLELRAKMLENMDVSFRLGYEQGFTEGQKQAEQAMQQQQMMQEQAMQQQMMQEQGAGGEMPPEEQAAMEQMQGEVPPEEQAAMEQMQGEVPPEELQNEQNASELDAHIQELESLVAKGEKPSILSMRSMVNKLADLRKNQKEKFKRNQSQVITSQKKLVDNILKKWESETNDSDGDELTKIIKESGVKLEG